MKFAKKRCVQKSVFYRRLIRQIVPASSSASETMPELHCSRTPGYCRHLAGTSRSGR